MPPRRWTQQARSIFRLVRENLSEPILTPSGADPFDTDPPVVLLHGFGGTPRMLRPLGRFLRRELGRPTLDLALGVGLGDIRDSAMRVHQLLADRGITRCDIVGYSMGGLVATYLLKCLDHGRSIRQVITLATPHRGVPLVSRWPAAFVHLVRSAGQMTVSSPFLAQLGRVPLPEGIRMLSIAGERDAIVPPDSARLDECGCRNIVAPGVGHAQMLISRGVFRLVAKRLRRNDPVASRTPDRAIVLPSAMTVQMSQTLVASAERPI
jgi:pimeloyl-ACP methyl ester carboxylesterase